MLVSISLRSLVSLFWEKNGSPRPILSLFLPVVILSPHINQRVQNHLTEWHNHVEDVPSGVIMVIEEF